MKNLKKFAAIGLTAAIAISAVACGNTNNGTLTEIKIGTWWVQHYDSNDTSLNDSPDYVNAIEQLTDTKEEIALKAINREIAEKKFDNVKRIEEKYGLKFYWNNLTYTGVQESINTSILAGTPDCELYLVETSMGVPAQVNGLAVDLKKVLPADADVFTDQKIVSYLDLGDGKVCILKRVEAQSAVEATYPLGFNLQMLQRNNLEDPRDLWERGEWTWDKFNEYCKVLTQDTDGDGQTDQYGYCGYTYETFEQLMMSNGASVATGKTQTLDSPEVGEALQQMANMYTVDKVCYPYDFEGSPSDTMRKQYTQGNIGFFPIAAWIESDCDDYDWEGDGSAILPFDVAYVRWPVGPSGNKDTNFAKNSTSGEYYIIPAGVAEPEKVYNFLYDLWDWDNGSTELRDSYEALNWWYKVTGATPEMQEANFNVMKDCGEHATFDLWNSLGVYPDFDGLIKGEITPAQFQETYKQEYQDGLDSYFK